MVSQPCHHVAITLIMIHSVLHCARAALIWNPALQYYWYIAMFDRVYLYCFRSVTQETSYVYNRTHPYNGAIRRFEETASSLFVFDLKKRPACLWLLWQEYLFAAIHCDESSHAI